MREDDVRLLKVRQELDLVTRPLVLVLIEPLDKGQDAHTIARLERGGFERLPARVQHRHGGRKFAA